MTAVPTGMSNSDWLTELRGLPSLYSYNFISESKNKYKSNDYMNEKVVDKLAAQTDKLATKCHEAIEGLDTEKLESAISNLKWLDNIR